MEGESGEQVGDELESVTLWERFCLSTVNGMQLLQVVK